MILKTKNTLSTKIKPILLLAVFLMSVLFPLLIIINSNFINDNSDTGYISPYLEENDFSNTYPKSSYMKDYDWWNGDWRFRIQLSTALVGYNKMDVHVYTTVNFTANLQKLEVTGETFDADSIRLVEYLNKNTFLETPYKINSSNPQNPDKIQLVWILNGTTLKDSSRLFYIYFDTIEYGPKSAPIYETLLPTTRVQYENPLLAIDDQANWYSWTDATTQLSNAESISLTDGTYIAGNNAFRSNGNDHFTYWTLINNPPFNHTVGNNADQVRYIDIWWYYMDTDADISLQIQDDGSWAKRWGFDVESTFNGYDWYREGNYVNQDPYEWRFYRLDLINQLHMDAGSWITGLAFSSDNGDVIYDHIMFEKYNTTVLIFSDEPEKKTAEITIITEDVDGKIVSNAQVFLLNNSALEPVIRTGFTDDQGKIIFENVSYGSYNITVKYALNPGLENVVYNSSELSIIYEVSILYPVFDISLDLWTIDFKVEDHDNKALSSGYINIKESSGTPSLVNLTLDENGLQRLVWLNRSSYYYEAYYRNYDYNPVDTLIEMGTVSRGTQIQNITADMSSLNIYVTEYDTGLPISDVLVQISNSSTGEVIVNLITSAGFAKDTSGNSFWYLRGDYNISLIFYGLTKPFNFTNEIPTTDSKIVTLDTYDTLNIDIVIDTSKFKSAFSDTIGDQTVIWGENMYFQVNFTVSIDGGIQWKPISTTANVIYYIRTMSDQVINSGEMDAPIDGIYSKTLNSSLLVANKNYKIVVFGSAEGFSEPVPVTFFITINPLDTQISVYDYTTQTNYTSNEGSAFWNEMINFTVFYYRSGDFIDGKLKGATLNYIWDYGSGAILQDPIKSEGYYFFQINTSHSPNVGKYQIKISAQLQNYTTITNFGFFLNILARPTSINGTTTLQYISQSIWIEQEFNFTFEYIDTLIDLRIGDLEEANYQWYEIGLDGIPLTIPSSSINLFEADNSLYILDFNTALRKAGQYAIFVTLQKYNYEVRNVMLNLRIREREFDSVLTATNLQGSQISIVQGNNIDFTLQLMDITRDNVPLNDATVKLVIADQEYRFNMTSNGIYEYSFSTSDIEAFFAAQVINGEIIITKDNFTSQTVSVNILINMTEIFPGFPMFYFLMIIGALVAVVGSLVAYRQIQRARIPTFVKKASAMKKEIKGRKSISESLLYPSKEEYIVKKLGDKWNMLGLSLESILGLEDKKRKKIPESSESKGGAE